MRTTLYLFLGAAVISAACATTAKFKSSDVTIRVENGYYKASIYYKYDDSVNGKSYLRYDYTDPTTMTEVIDYKDGTRSKVCGSTCETGFYPYGAPALFQQDSDIATGEVEGECYEYTPAVNYAITSIWYKKDKTLCKAALADGKTLIFNKGFDSNFNDNVFSLEGSHCPAPICKRVMDLVFVIDNSGSVSSSDWEKAKSFIIDVSNSFDIGTDATMIGVIAYGKSARTIIGLSGNKNSIVSAVTGAKYYGGTTCTGCGMDLAMKFFNSTSAARNALNPEKMMMVVTDGENNELDYYQYCRRYTPSCTAVNRSICIKYECKGASHMANGPLCLEYRNTTTCLKKVCSKCRKQGQCIKYDTSVCAKRSSTVCARRSTTYCNGNPSSYCCSRNSNGVLSNKNWCGRCDCTDYRCDEYACEEYKCLVYDCSDCETYSQSECLIYKQDCVRHQQVKVCDVPEVCIEYKCTNAKLTCAEWGLGANSLLAGAVSRTRTKWCLMPASERTPIVIAIGVSGANKYELMGIASTLEGKQLIYTVSDFSKLKTIINDLVDETCTKQTNNLENCDDGCKGFCGCNKKCYCPKCDTANGNCYTIGCRTDGKTSTGCAATHNTCPNDNKCIKKTPNNKTEGCCVTTNVNCVKSPSKCKIYGCDPKTGCTETDVVCVPSSPCFVATCDPSRGCVETSVCDTSNKCKDMTCKVVNGKPQCTYEDKCKSTDLCQLPVCDNQTGKCSTTPKVCPLKNPCNKVACYNGECIEDLNVTKKIECASYAGDSCTEGYCDEKTGKCETRKIEGSANCQNCGLNTTLNCASRTDECFIYTCDAGEPDGSEYPTKCVPENICHSDDPCVTKTCQGGKCVVGNPCGDPKDACETVMCVADTTQAQGYRCERTTTVEEDDPCWTYKCNNETGESIAETRCPVNKCGKLDKCTIIDGKADCVYTPTHNCTGNKCVEATCVEATGECEYLDLTPDCQGDDPCRIYMCNNESGCYSEPVNCDDGDPCTVDACVPVSELDSPYTSEEARRGYVCQRTPKCPKRSFCENAYCDSEGKCTYSDYACDGPNETEAIDSCHTLQCSDVTNSCVSVILPSAFLDVCGSCVKEYGKDPSLNVTAAATACIGKMKMPDFAAAISGGALAAIIVVAIIVAAVIAVSSTLGTRELIKRAKKNADVGTNSNPLYEGNDNEASNPAFMGDN